MNGNRELAGPEITRRLYKKVKAFDHSQLTNFCRDLYNQGVKDGQRSVKCLSVDDIYKEIGSVKGIGEKKLADIKAALDALYDGGKNGKG